jgi:hypothetical protein
LVEEYREWKHSNEVNEKPPLEDIILGNQFQIGDVFVGVWVFVALHEV